MIRTVTPVVLTEDALVRARDQYLERDAFVFDLETVGEHRGIPGRNKITWLGLASYGLRTVIPMGHPLGSRQTGTYKEPRTDKNGKIRRFTMPKWDDPPEQLSPDVVFDILKPLFFSPTTIKAAHGLATFDLPTLTPYYGEMPPPPYECTITLPWMVNENFKNYGLKFRTKQDYGVDYDKENTGKCVEIYPFGKVAHYLWMDVAYAWMIYRKNAPQIKRQELERVHDLETGLVPALTRMRLHPMHVDVPRLEELEKTLAARLVGEKAEVYRAAGQECNINAAGQLQKILYAPKSEGGQGLRGWKMTPGGKAKKEAGEEEHYSWWSTEADVLEGFPANKLCTSLLAFKQTQKLHSTYVLSWLGEEGNPKKPCRIVDGQLYTTLKPWGADTGRFSSEQPNLQNIPRPDTEDGKLLRGAFIAPDGYKLIVADYGQIELVILAHLIGHGALFEGFHHGVDPHLVCASKVLGIPQEKVTKDQRQTYGKTLGFTIVNGAGYRRVADMTGKTDAAAKRILRRHEEEFPEIYKFKRDALRIARNRRPPHVRTLMGRKRRLPELNYKDFGRRSLAERQLFNTLIQGGAADLIKLAMIRCDAMYEERLPQAHLALTVHDELIAIAPDNIAGKAREIMVEAMTGPGIQDMISVPLSVDSSIVDRWSDAK